jgi:hypothetical protein
MAKIQQEILDFEDEASLIEKLHSDTLTQAHPVNRCAARGLKVMLPVYIRWMREELDRGTDPGTIMHAQSGIFMSLIGTAISQQAKPEYFNEAMVWFINMFARHMEQVIRGEVNNG